MFLLVSNIAHYLIAKGLVEPSAVVRGGMVITEDNRRNRNFKLSRSNGPGLFLKQVKSMDHMAISTLCREAECYRLAHSQERFAALARLMPPFIDFDPTRNILILGLLPGAENLSQYFLRQGCYPAQTGEMLGQALGACHTDAGYDFLGANKSNVFPHLVPWILSLPSHGEAMFPEASSGHLALMKLLRSYPRFTAMLEQLRTEWRQDSLIHGDIKWDNLLLHEENGQPKLRLVDWELADCGDAAWDLGGVFQSYVASWIFALPHTETPVLVRQDTDLLLANMQTNIAAFWRAYLLGRKLGQAQRKDLLLRGIRYGAARLVQTTFECLHQAPQLNAKTRMMLQASYNILENPERASQELFGLYEVAR